ncbi:MAG: ATP-binding protein [Gemmatimonadota bacterium]|nr:ATP-binding protein [Gemmatimonadota bacterium]
MIREPIVLAWSGGKDSAVALERLRADSHLEVVALLTTITGEYDRISIHGVRRSLLQAQAAAVEVPVVEAVLPASPENAVYETVFAEALARLRHEHTGLTRVAFGDLFLADLRAWREAQLARLGLTAHFPLWGIPTDRLAWELVARGFRSVVTTVDLARLPASFAGRAYDAALLADLPPDIDPCGENGEFHTFVTDGPCFRRPIAVKRGDTVIRDGVAYADLLPVPVEPEGR